MQSHVDPLEIQNTLDSLNDELMREFNSDSAWTRAIKKALIDLGKNKYHLSCYASSTSAATSGEWLYDICWINYQNDSWQVELTAECEWLDHKEVLDDFEKLVQSRCSYRLMIWQSVSKEIMEKDFDEMRARIKEFYATESGDKYLFSCWLGNKKGFVHKSYTHASN